MNAVDTLSHLPWITRLGWTLLNFLWQGALIAALLSAWRALSWSRSGAEGRYFAACAALAAMAIAALVTYALLDPRAAGGGPAAAAVYNPPTPTGAPATMVPVSIGERLTPWLGAAWVVGVILGLLRLLGGWLAIIRLRSAHARPAPAECQSTVASLAARLGVARPVRLVVSMLVETPAVMGWLRPVILVPVGALAGLPAAHLEALLAHELAHIRRHDYFINLLQSLAEALLFYHPAVWWVSRVIRAEREYCCDDLAVAAAGGDVLNYARALAELESCRPAHAAAMGASGGSLRNRIRRLVDPSRVNSQNLPCGAAAWALAAMLLVSAGALAVRAAESPARAQEPVLDRQSIWLDSVRFGDFIIEVRGLGTLTSATAAEIKLAPSQAGRVAAGQTVAIAFRGRRDTIAGHIEGVRPGVQNGVVTADVTVTDPLPAGIQASEPIDVTVTIERLTNVVNVGRPVFAKANSEGRLFKLDPDGQHATQVPVLFGRISVNAIEIKSGLQPGDRIILSDMSPYEKFDRIALQ